MENADPKCPCGKPHCDCCKNADKARLAWVKAHCKFAQLENADADIPMEQVMAEAAKLGIPPTDLTPNKILEIKRHLLRKKQVPPPAPAKLPGRGGNPHGLPRAKPLGQDPWRGVREDVA